MYRPFEQDIVRLQSLLAVARGDQPADVLLTGAQLVNVLSGESYPAEVALVGDRIAAVSASPGLYRAHKTLDLAGEYLAPGFIDAHVHIETTLLAPPAFATAVVPHGTTTVVSDPHEMANVLGLDGLRYMLASSEGLALRVLVMLASCVPVSTMETSGAALGAEELATLINHPRVLGIAEVMNYPGVVSGASNLLAKVALGHQAGLRVDGHAPLLRGPALQAYLAAGVASDHECVSADEALEKLRAGMQIMIREGSTAKNLDALLPLVSERTAPFCSFSTDDKHPDDLQREGHVDHNVRRAIAAGLDPLLALRMATISTARHFGLWDLGAIAPGYVADLVTFADLQDLRITRTFAHGQLVAEGGHMLVDQQSGASAPPLSIAVRTLDERSFAISATGGRVRVIEVIPEQVVTGLLVVDAPIADGHVVAAPEWDLLKIAVIERHKSTGNIGLGLVTGFGLRSGALASSITHDSHNLIIVGASDEEMLLAARTVIAMGGGIVAVHGADVLAQLPLPIAGLMSDQPFETVRVGMRALLDAARTLGCPLSDPYMAMAFLALPVIPALKLTDLGLVDVRQFALCPLFVE